MVKLSTQFILLYSKWFVHCFIENIYMTYLYDTYKLSLFYWRVIRRTVYKHNVSNSLCFLFFKAMPHGSDFYNEFAKIHQIYEKSYRRWTFQRNRYSSTCTAKSLFAVNRGFKYGSDRHSGVYY